MIEQAKLKAFLGRETIIRWTGVLLALSPVGNIFVSLASSGIPYWYRRNVLFFFLQNLSLQFWLTSLLNVLAGALMMKGRRSSWIFTLCVIGATFLVGLFHIRSDFQDSGARTISAFLINGVFFGLIYSQEAHQRVEKRLREAQAAAAALAERAKSIQPPPFKIRQHFNFQLQAEKSQTDIPARPEMSQLPNLDPKHPVKSRRKKVDFDGIGTWAEISEVTQSEIRMTPINGAKRPEGIETRVIEIMLTPDVVVSARYTGRAGVDYCFRLIKVNPAASSWLRGWKSNAA